MKKRLCLQDKRSRDPIQSTHIPSSVCDGYWVDTITIENNYRNNSMSNFIYFCIYFLAQRVRAYARTPSPSIHKHVVEVVVVFSVRKYLFDVKCEL